MSKPILIKCPKCGFKYLSTLIHICKVDKYDDEEFLLFPESKLDLYKEDKETKKLFGGFGGF